MSNNNKKAYCKQQSKRLTLYDILNLIAKKTGCNPKLSGKNYISSCPSHDDKHASLSTREADNGSILFNCFAGCYAEEICTALGIKVRDLFPSKKRGSSYG